jgi:PKD repeat protein
MSLNRIRTLAMLVGTLLAGPALAQVSNQITAISPDSAEQGTQELLVTFTLDTDVPPPPPAGMAPDAVTLGALVGTAVSHPARELVTAMFEIPLDEPEGVKDAVVVFTTPNGTVTFTRPGGFRVTPAPNSPPSILEQPVSRTVRPGEAVSFTVTAAGSPPLSHQWLKDGLEIDGATAPAYAIPSVSEADAGVYRCLVVNDYGSVTSEAATLTVDMSVPIVTAPYVVVDTGQTACYDDVGPIACPASGQPFEGQDAQHAGYAPGLTISGDGLTVHDATTGLTWQRSTDTDGNGVIDAADKLTFAEALVYAETLNASGFGGFSDWRLPTIKELYSLMDFRGTDPSSYTGSDPSVLRPFLDTGVFDFGYGDTSAGERLIDAQYVSSTVYGGTTMGGNATVFGVNFADGRIKGYPQLNKTFYVLYVRGNPAYGHNQLVDNGDGTVTDLATGLMWQQEDSAVGLDWQAALAYAENLDLAGHTDWRLPDAKELQSIVDYTRCPQSSGSAAIDPIFDVTSILNEAGQVDYPCYWSGTTHATWDGGGGWGAYVAFGRAMGYWANIWQDVHGAGAQRSDPKSGDPGDYPTGHGPQGDAVRIANHVRCVRGGEGSLSAGFTVSPEAPTEGAPVTLTGSAAGGTSPYGYSWDLDGTAESGATVLVILEAGIHTVDLTVTDTAGLETVLSGEITVTADSLPPVADGKLAGEAALFVPGADDPERIEVTYGVVPCSAARAVILYGHLGDYTGYAGSALDDAGNSGTAVFDSAGLENVWFNIVWTSGSAAGHPGYAYDGVEDVERTWDAAGFAGLTLDQHTDGTCE